MAKRLSLARGISLIPARPNLPSAPSLSAPDCVGCVTPMACVTPMPMVDDSGLPLLSHDVRIKGSQAFVYVAFLFPALAGMLFGYDIGSTSGAIIDLGCTLGGFNTSTGSKTTSTECLDSIITGSTADPLLTGLITSSSLFGAFLGTIICFFVGGVLGRRREIILGAFLYGSGTVLTVVAAGANQALLPTVVAGRAIYGLGIAFSMHAAPVYIAEMAPPAIRGFLISAKEAFIVGGILLGFGMTALFRSFAIGSAWRMIWAVPAPFGMIIFFGMMVMPPSPRWLVLRALERQVPGPAPASLDTSAALAALKRFRAGYSLAEAEAEIRDVVNTLSEGLGGSWSAVFRGWRALLAGIGLVLLQQVTGQPSVLYYSNAIFTDAGFGSFAADAAIIVGAAKLAATLVTVFFVDRYGRRTMLFVGITMMFCALLVLATGFASATVTGGGDLSLPGSWPAFIVIALMLYVCGYQVGFGPIAWLMCA